jgi:hypothetical protein
VSAGVVSLWEEIGKRALIPCLRLTEIGQIVSMEAPMKSSRSIRVTEALEESVALVLPVDQTRPEQKSDWQACVAEFTRDPHPSGHESARFERLSRNVTAYFSRRTIGIWATGLLVAGGLTGTTEAKKKRKKKRKASPARLARLTIQD